MKSIYRTVIGALAVSFITGCISPELRTARIAMNERDYDRALAAADAELARMPNSAEPLFIKGQIYELRGDWGKMSQAYDACLKASPQFSSRIKDSRARLVRKYYSLSVNASKDSLVAIEGEKAWQKALTYLDTALIVDPNELLLLQQGAVTAYYAKDFDRAIQFAEKAISMEPKGKEDFAAREVLVIAYTEKKDHAKTIRWARELMNLANPETDTSNTYLKALDAVIAAQEEMNDYVAADQTLQEAEKRFPDLTVIKMNRALFALKRKDYDAAKILYIEALKIDPANFDANLNMGTLLANEEKWKECEPYLVKALETDPKNRIALTNLMAAYFNSEQYDKGNAIKARLDALGQGK